MDRTERTISGSETIYAVKKSLFREVPLTTLTQVAPRGAKHLGDIGLGGSGEQRLEVNSSAE